MAFHFPILLAYGSHVEEDLAAGLKQAKAKRQPARMGVGTGTAYINVNRDERTSTGAFRLGRNLQGSPFLQSRNQDHCRIPPRHGLPDRNPDDFDPAGGFQRQEQRCGNCHGPRWEIPVYMNRGDDSIVVFFIHPAEGTLTKIQRVPNRGGDATELQYRSNRQIFFGCQSGFE